MSQLAKKRNGGSLPSLVDEFFNRDRFFSSGILDVFGNLHDLERSGIVPHANITETEKDFKVELAAPGLEKKDFKIEIEDDVLTISSEKKLEKKEEKKHYRRMEFSYNSFSRSFTLPENCDVDKIDAKYEEGILKLSLPKKEVTISRPKKEIKIS